MREVVYLLRFFHTVPPVPPMMIGTLAIVTATSVAVVAVDAGRAPGVLAPVLLLQLFAASSGFATPARRGHYDLLLTRSGRRSLTAAAHWASSVVPGVTSWLVIAVAETVASRGASRTMLASGTWAAVFLVSTLPWAITVALPRFSGGIGWLLVLVTASSTFSMGVFDTWGAASTRIEALAWPAWVFLIYPVAAVGQSLARPQWMAVLPALLLAVCAMAAACRWIAHADIPLEAAQ